MTKEIAPPQVKEHSEDPAATLWALAMVDEDYSQIRHWVANGENGEVHPLRTYLTPEETRAVIQLEPRRNAFHYQSERYLLQSGNLTPQQARHQAIPESERKWVEVSDPYPGASMWLFPPIPYRAPVSVMAASERIVQEKWSEYDHRPGYVVMKQPSIPDEPDMEIRKQDHLETQLSHTEERR